MKSESHTIRMGKYEKKNQKSIPIFVAKTSPTSKKVTQCLLCYFKEIVHDGLLPPDKTFDFNLYCQQPIKDN